jgi:FlaA1/EpsC-like NDP-sugar epimerase
MARSGKRAAVLDVCLLALSVYLGFALRLTFLIGPEFRDDLLFAAAVFPLCVVLFVWFSGGYKIYWPQASVEEYARLCGAYVTGAAVFLGIYLSAAYLVPRSSLAVMFFSGLIFTGAMRASWRLAEFYVSSGTGAGELKTTIIIGAGEAGAYLARDLTRNGSSFAPIGFIDSDAEKQGKVIAGLPVLGGDDDLEDICSRTGVRVALIAIPSAGGDRVRKYLDALGSVNIEVRVLPSLRALAGGGIELGSLRSVELEDLLRRDPIHLDEAGISTVITGRRVLVTGAGGSIGSEICVQVLKHSPAELLALGHGEQSIYALGRRLSEAGLPPAVPIIADAADRSAMERVFDAHRPEIVFHAAAHKHVPLMEDNPWEALRVNSFGTWVISDTAGRYGAKKFVLISTDKAVRPSSVMGATKFIAEGMMQKARDEHPDTAYIAVRFGNVLGSRGSVVPLFESQIMRGGPVTVTHPEMRRYFMLIPEAVSLVLESASMGLGGELYVLDMGEPVNIAQMAETLIRLHGREPHSEVRIEFTGTRRGEKLFEELFYDPAHTSRTGHEKIFLSKLDYGEVLDPEDIKSLLDSVSSDEEIRNFIFSMVPGAIPSENQ